MMEDNWFIGDLHIHSRFSRACSKNINFENLVKWAKIKGLNLLGTGDFTHPVWFEEIKKLKEKNGFYYFEDFPFVLSSEISLVYTENEKGRRIHLVYLAPNLEVVNKINEWLDTKGRRDYDGRPIFKISCKEFTAKMEEIDNRIEVIPAHCLVKGSLIETIGGMKKIEDIEEKDKVLTHRGKYKEVEEVHERLFKGEIFEVVPACMKIGTFFTFEHPIYAIKSYKTCKNVSHTICKPNCAYLKRGCKIKAFEKYKKSWIQVKDLEKGDIILYPRYKKIVDKFSLLLSDFFKGYLDDEYIKPRKEKGFIKNILIKNKINVSEDFCRLIGYYLAEGYCVKEHIAFTFHEKEREYMEDVRKILIDIFGPFLNIKLKKEKSKGVTLSVHSKILYEFFKTFYLNDTKRSYNKKLPEWFIDLPNNKLKQLLIGWWRGDTGCTTSINLFNQFKQIFIKLGIIPAITKISAESVNKRREFKKNSINGRRIIAKNDLFYFTNLSFFDENLDLLELKEFKKFKAKLIRRRGWIDKDYIYLPIVEINKKNYKGMVYNLKIDKDNSYLTENLAVHNCWTPWFGIFGSKGGYDTLIEAFGDKADKIHAIETGISSTPEMNWRIKELENRSIVSFSDAHSMWPWRLGREATIFKKTDSYEGLIEQIRNNDFIGTIETDPAYGRYHWDGHSDCNFSCSPEESKKLDGICPICKKKLIIGVDSRVEDLSENPLGFKPLNGKMFYRILPLHEILSLYYNKGMNTKTVWDIYNSLIEKFGNEFEILLSVSREEFVQRNVDDKLIDLILKNREGKIKVKAGFDGEYGTPILSEDQSKLF